MVPGGIDVHTHMELPFGGTFAKDTFETGTRAAAFGGTTTIVDFAVQPKGQALREGLDAWLAKAEGNAVVDYGFHMIMSDVNDATWPRWTRSSPRASPTSSCSPPTRASSSARRPHLPGDAADARRTAA